MQHDLQEPQPAQLPVVNTLWIGDALGPIERACLRSALRQGHKVRLFTYGSVPGIPEGVEVADAAEIVSPDRIVRYDNGSVALFANLFRYVLQQRGFGLWVDTDHYFVKPHDFTEPYVFGRLVNGRIANGVLRMPAESPILPLLLELFDGLTIPPWADERERQRAQDLRDMHGRIPLGQMPWAFTGPRAVTYFVSAFGLDHLAKSPDVFYPANFTVADWICDPSITLDEIVAPNTVGVHLWNQKIKDFKNKEAPPGSFLFRLQREGR